MSAVCIEHLTRRYGRRIGVEGLRLNVSEGDLFGFLGPNGAGKTTTIRVLLGFLKANEGRARIFGLDCWRDSQQIKEEVGYLPGDLRLYPWLTCREAVRLVGLARGRDLRAAGDQLADHFALDPQVRVRAMSRGMRQKLGLILALAHNPRLLVLDEPTASLDPLMQEKLYDHLRVLAGAGHTVFFSSHSLSEVDRLCNRVAILRDGSLVADQTLEAMREQARRLVVIHWKTDAETSNVTPPTCLEVFERKDRQWQASLTGSVQELLRWSASQPVEDFSIGQPDLNRLFRRFYANTDEQA